MSAAELVWRARNVLQRAYEQRGFGLALHPPMPEAVPAGWQAVFPQAALQQADAVVAAADEVLAGRWHVFAQRGLALGFPPHWNRCPRTGVQAPMHHGMAIDYRRESLVGDIKYLWEPSRHAELVTLALAWAQGGQTRHAQGARELLLSWMEQCPYPQGVHWGSALELAVRLLHWAVAWPLLSQPSVAGVPGVFEGAAGTELRMRWLQSVYQHAHFIEHHLSLHSSANNHLFGEYMGLFVAALRWPCWPESQHWAAVARAGLEREATLQVADDGVNREQAIYYHHEVMSMMLFSDRFAAAAGQPLSDAFARQLERMAEHLYAVMDCAGHVPMIGDADDAHMLPLAHPAPATPYAPLLAACALRFRRADFKAKARGLDAATRQLWGPGVEADWDALGATGPERPRLSFPEGGYHLLGSGFGTCEEVRIVIDCGPLGYLSIAAHGHADALAFTLSVAGHELLIDPGTYAYHTQTRWRNHFRSTAAHNTVQVDGCDQSVIGGNFMWIHKARSTLLAHHAEGPFQHFAGRHDGYARLPDPVLHERELRWDVDGRTLTVRDTLLCRSSHEVALHWHFAESCRVRVGAQPGTLDVAFGAGVIGFTCAAPGFELALLQGSENPLGGWVSRRFDDKQPTVTARWRGRIDGGAEGRCEITTVIHLGARRQH